MISNIKMTLIKILLRLQVIEYNKLLVRLVVFSSRHLEIYGYSRASGFDISSMTSYFPKRHNVGHVIMY